MSKHTIRVNNVEITAEERPDDDAILVLTTQNAEEKIQALRGHLDHIGVEPIEIIFVDDLVQAVVPRGEYMLKVMMKLTIECRLPPPFGTLRLPRTDPFATRPLFVSVLANTWDKFVH